MSEITLTASIRSNLMSLRATADMLGKTSERLATGKKINSAVDDPVSYFKAKGLTDRAGDLFGVKDGMNNSIQIVETTLAALESIEDTLKQMKGIADGARSSSSLTERAAALAEYNGLRTQLDNLTNDASFDGVNLIKGTPDTKTVKLNEDGTATLALTGSAADSAGLSVTAALTGAAVADAWDHATIATGNIGIDKDIALIDAAIDSIRSKSSTFGNNASFLKTRVDFTDKLISNLEIGAANLVNADMETEAANMLALQTRQQLGMQSLSFASQSEQSILRLF